MSDFYLKLVLGAVEEVLQLESAAGRMDVLVAGNSGNRALVHPHRLGDVPEKHEEARGEMMTGADKYKISALQPFGQFKRLGNKKAGHLL